MALTVTEKEHWKQRLEARIDKEIARKWAALANLKERLAERARKNAQDSLGIAELLEQQAELEKKKDEVTALIEDLGDQMIARVEGVPIAEVRERNAWQRNSVVDRAIEERTKLELERLLAETEQTQPIVALEAEKERLLDVVWLATGSSQIKELWGEVGKVLGDADTQLLDRAQKMSPVDD